MEILTEFDGLQEALKKVKLDENVLPYVNGRLIDDRAWNKTQKLLNCPEMISAHKFLYNLDMDQLTEDEMAKIDQLYKLGCDRGFIIDDLTDWNKDDDEQVEVKDEVVEKPAEKPVAGSLFKAKVPCWTVIYSATSADGAIKTGEAYSNAISASAAKADVNAKLSRIGYSNIAILAIEAADPDTCKAYDSSVDINVNEADDEKDDEKDDADADADTESDESSDDSGAKGSDDSEDDSSADEEESSDEDENSENSSDDSNKDDSEDDSNDDSSSEDNNGDESDKESDKESDSDEESDEDDEQTDDADDSEETNDGEEKEELDANQKSELKDKYRKTFKNTLVKCKFDTSFNDLTLEQKVKFFTELSKAWKKNEPSEFMTDKEVEQLNNVVVNNND